MSEGAHTTVVMMRFITSALLALFLASFVARVSSARVSPAEVFVDGKGGVGKPSQPLRGENLTEDIQYHLDYIRSRGYPAEYHTATTEDGYVLSLFRIPHGKSQSTPNQKKAVLWHGLLGSSFSYVTNQGDQSLSYIMADAGYDVYLPNSRGNTFSRKNIHYDINNTKFWDFSFDEQVTWTETTLNIKREREREREREKG